MISTPIYPFVAIVGQEEMKRALILSMIDPRIGGVMIMGHRGTGKSTSVRALANLMTPLDAVDGCPFNCAADDTAGLCDRCTADDPSLRTVSVPVPVVDLPLGATEDRVAGTIDIEYALIHGVRRFEPGLVARANRGFLYIDEVNLLEDHLVDLLLDVAASGVNVVEREGISVRHPAHFSLVGSGNPEEGELRPQLLDRFGLHAFIQTEQDVEQRIEIIRRRMAFDDDPLTFIDKWTSETERLRERIERARGAAPHVELHERHIASIAAISSELGIHGHRGELVIARASRANAAFEGRDRVAEDDLRTLAPLALRHRLRTDPLELVDPGLRIERALRTVLG